MITGFCTNQELDELKEYGLKQLCLCGFKGIYPWDPDKDLTVCPNCGNKLSSDLFSLGVMSTSDPGEWTLLEERPGVFVYKQPVVNYVFDLSDMTIQSDIQDYRVEIDFSTKRVQAYKDYPDRAIEYVADFAIGGEVQILQADRLEIREAELSKELYKAWTKYRPEWPIHRWRGSVKGNLTALGFLLEYPTMTLLTAKECYKFVYNQFWSGQPFYDSLNLTGTNPREILRITKGQDRAIQDYWNRHKQEESAIFNLMDKYLVLKGLERELGSHYATELFKREQTLPLGSLNIIRSLVHRGINKNNLGKWLIASELDAWSEDLPRVGETVRLARLLGEDILNWPINRILRESLAIRRRYQTSRDQYLTRDLVLAYERHRQLEWAKGPFKFVVPGKAEDFREEAKELQHCIETYMGRYAEDELVIVMLREEGKPRITVELRDKTIVQVKGKFNRGPSLEEVELIRAWAIEKDLTIGTLG